MCRRVAYLSIKDKSERGVRADLKQKTIRQKTSGHKKTEVEKLTDLENIRRLGRSTNINDISLGRLSRQLEIPGVDILINY